MHRLYVNTTHILFKGSEHLWILVSLRSRQGPGINLLWIRTKRKLHLPILLVWNCMWICMYACVKLSVQYLYLFSWYGLRLKVENNCCMVNSRKIVLGTFIGLYKWNTLIIIVYINILIWVICCKFHEI